MIYKYKAEVSTAAGSTNSSTLNVLGGRCGQLIIRAGTDSTVFKAYVTDKDGDVVLNYPYATGEINDWNINIPMTGKQYVYITNASPDDTFKVILQVDEG